MRPVLAGLLDFLSVSGWVIWAVDSGPLRGPLPAPICWVVAALLLAYVIAKREMALVACRRELTFVQHGERLGA